MYPAKTTSPFSLTNLTITTGSRPTAEIPVVEVGSFGQATDSPLSLT